MTHAEERSPDQKIRRNAGIAGAVIFIAASIMELVRMTTTRFPWPGFNAALDWLITLISIVLWLGSAYALAARRREYVVFAIFGAFALLNQGLLGTIAGSPFGIIYVLLAVPMVILERLTFGGKLTLGTRWAPDRPISEPQII
jgi:hypothetical protein